MSQAKKKFMRRKIAQAVKHQMLSIDALLEVRELFNEYHPEWDDLFTGIANNCMVTINFIKGLAIAAWSYFPDDLSKWLK